MTETEVLKYIEERAKDYSTKYPQMSIEACPPMGAERLCADLLIKKDGKPIAAIVVKMHPNSSDIEDAKCDTSEHYKNYDIYYVIIVRNEKYCLVAIPPHKEGSVLVYAPTIEEALDFFSNEFSKIDTNKGEIELMAQDRLGQAWKVEKSKIIGYRP